MGDAQLGDVPKLGAADAFGRDCASIVDGATASTKNTLWITRKHYQGYRKSQIADPVGLLPCNVISVPEGPQLKLV